MFYDDIAFGLALSLHSATTNQEGLKSWSVHCQRKRSVRGQAKVAESPEFRLKQVSPPLADCPKGQSRSRGTQLCQIQPSVPSLREQGPCSCTCLSASIQLPRDDSNKEILRQGQASDGSLGSITVHCLLRLSCLQPSTFLLIS